MVGSAYGIVVKFRLLFLFAILSPVAFAQPRPLDGNPGNIFVRGQEVVVNLTATGSGKWICVDYDGKRISGGEGGEARIGKTGTGYYEIWQLADDGSRTSRTTFAVIEPLKVAVPDDTPIALDTAASWFFHEGRKFGLREAANVSALAGVHWTRDRLSWTQTEPAKGEFAAETIYDKSAAAFSAEGLKVLQVFHDTPSWAGRERKFFPDDYRDVHRYLKTMSARWKGKVQAWEPWNEGDTTNFGGHTGAEMMAYQRAAWHGIRAGNPEAVVGMNVFATHEKTGVLENFMENIVNEEPGVSRMPFDTFNFHHYIKPGKIPESYREMKEASNGLPVWVTESYFHFRQGVKKNDLDLSDDQRKLRARFVTTNLVTALNEGPSAFFTFVLPHYLENGVLFGMLNEDGTPRADYVALAAAGRLLAGGKPTGEMNGEAHAYTFHARPDGVARKVVVLWTDKEEVGMPEALVKYEKAYDFLGREISPEKIGTSPVYLLFPPDSGQDPDVSRKQAPSIQPASPFVIQAVFPHDRLRIASSSWQVGQKETLAVPLRFYHFGEGERKVSVTIEAEDALEASVSIREFTIAPEGRTEATMTIGWSGTKVPARALRVKVTAKSEGLPPCVAVHRISTEMGEVEPEARKALAASKQASTWAPGSSKGELAFNVTDGVVRVSAKLGDGDRWVYPWHSVSKDEKPSPGTNGIAFTLVPKKGDAVYHVMFKEPGGAMYSASLGMVQADGKPRRMVMTLDEFHWAAYSPEDANHQLDLGAIEGLAIGGNPKGSEFEYEAGDIEWVTFAK